MDIHSLLLSVLILLAATVCSVLLFGWLRLGSLLGLLVAGVIAGPSGFDLISHVTELRDVAELGIVLLLFTTGLEMRIQRLWSMRRLLFGMGGLQILVTGSFIFLFLYNVPSVPWQEAAILGFGLSLSSTAFVMQILEERGDMKTGYGNTSFAILLFQDLAVVPVLAIIPVLSHRLASPSLEGVLRKGGTVVAVLAAVWVLGRYVVPWCLSWAAGRRDTAMFRLLSALGVLAAICAMEVGGLSLAMGAFLMGMLLSASEHRMQMAAVLEPYKRLLLGLFFISVGMSINVDLLWKDLGDISWMVARILALKVVVLLLVGLLFRLPRETLLRSSFLLSQCGEFGFVLFSVALARGLMSDEAYSVALAAISVSMAATPFMAKAGDWLAERFAPRSKQQEPFQLPEGELGKHIVLLGYGRVGSVLCRMFVKLNVPYLVFDIDFGKVLQGKNEGARIYYGDIRDPEVLQSARLENAAGVVIAIDHLQTTGPLVRAIRHRHPNTPLFVQGHNFTECEELVRAGATHSTPVVVHSSLSLGFAVLQGIGVRQEDIRSVVEALLKDDCARLRIPSVTA